MQPYYSLYFSSHYSPGLVPQWPGLSWTSPSGAGPEARPTAIRSLHDRAERASTYCATALTHSDTSTRLTKMDGARSRLVCLFIACTRLSLEYDLERRHAKYLINSHKFGLHHNLRDKSLGFMIRVLYSPFHP